MTKTNARYLFLAFVLLCGTVASILTKEGGYFGGAIFCCGLLGLFGLIDES